jgi:hypothetical protein
VTRIRLVAAAVLLTAVAGLVPATAVAAGDTSTTRPPPDAPSIIPRPDSGTEPTDAGDRGGALQTILFIVMLGGVIVVGALVVRESRRARERRGF